MIQQRPAGFSTRAISRIVSQKNSMCSKAWPEMTTSMLAVAIFLSIAALGAVAIIGYQMLNKPQTTNLVPAVVQPAPAEVNAAK